MVPCRSQSRNSSRRTNMAHFHQPFDRILTRKDTKRPQSNSSQLINSVHLFRVNSRPICFLSCVYLRPSAANVFCFSLCLCVSVVGLLQTSRRHSQRCCLALQGTKIEFAGAEVGQMLHAEEGIFARLPQCGKIGFAESRQDG